MTARLEVYDPALCCSTGVCGPSPDPVLPRFAADLEWLRLQGVAVARHGLSQEPAAFAAEAAVRRALEERGVACLPLVLVDGRVLSKGRYPERDELAAAVGLAPRGVADPSRTLDVELLALDLETCDRCTGSAAALDAAMAEAQAALRAAGVAVRVRKTVVETVEQAQALRFSSSPTIRVDGRDIALEQRESTCGSCGEVAGSPVDCRVWVYRGEEHTVVPKGMVVEAILREARGPSAPEGSPPAFVVPDNIRRFLAGRARAGAAGPASCCAPTGTPTPRSEKPRVSKGRCC